MTDELKTITARHLDDYSKCSNFGKFNWNRPELSNEFYLPIKNILLDCYADIANLEKKCTWKTVRNRAHSHLSPLIHTKSLTEYQKYAIEVINSLRVWYLEYYREGLSNGITSIPLTSVIPNSWLELKDKVDVLLLSNKERTLIDINNHSYNNHQEFTNSFYFRVKAWLLSKHGVDVNKFLSISIKGTHLSFHTSYIVNPKDMNIKTGKVIQILTGSIKHNIHYPSVSEMCVTCPYKNICKW